MTARIVPPPYCANDGAPSTALRAAARWCVVATETIAAEHLDAPSLAPVEAALVAAVAAPTRATLDALAAVLTRWCERASSDAYDHFALAPLMLAAVDAAGACCTCAETADAR